MRLLTDYGTSELQRVVEHLQDLLIEAMKREDEDAIFSYISALNSIQLERNVSRKTRTYRLQLD